MKRSAGITISARFETTSISGMPLVRHKSFAEPTNGNPEKYNRYFVGRALLLVPPVLC